MSEETHHPAKIDFKKSLATYSATLGRFDVTDVPEMQYLMVDGHGDPNTSQEYTAALEALYPVAYKLKFASKREHGRDYVVPPLEGLWWSDDMSAFTTARDKSQWHWTMMLMVPEWIGTEQVSAAIEQVRPKHSHAGLEKVRFAPLVEGRCVQTLHVGAYDDEAPVLERMHHEFVPAHDLQLTGKHHEIYLSDPRRVAPEKLRTVLRQPVRSL